MPNARCPRSDCASNAFVAQPIDVADWPYQLIAFQCKWCGAVISIKEPYDLARLLSQIANKLDVKLDP